METGHQMRVPLVLLGESQVLQDSPVHQHWHDRSQAEHGSRGELIIIVPFVSFVIVHCAFGRLCRFHACFGISRRSFAGHTWTLLPRRKQKFGLQDFSHTERDMCVGWESALILLIHLTGKIAHSIKQQSATLPWTCDQSR